MRQQKKCCPIQFKDDFEEFIEYLRLRPLRESTIKYQHDILIPILLNFDSYGVKSWNDYISSFGSFSPLFTSTVSASLCTKFSTICRAFEINAEYLG